MDAATEISRHSLFKQLAFHARNDGINTLFTHLLNYVYMPGIIMQSLQKNYTDGTIARHLPT